MKTVLLLAALLCAVFSSNAEARHIALHKDCNILFPCEAPSASTPQAAREARGRYFAREMGFGAPVKKAHRRVQKPRQRAVFSGRPDDVQTGPKASSVFRQRNNINNLALTSSGRSEAAIVSHPEGCPARLFCGCGAAVRVFGHSVRELWLAANWFKFPRAAPAPGMAAVKRHHVMVLEADLGGGVWRVFDANSGRHLTRIHARSIAGYQIVNPHGPG